ncbi:hypothetical protein QJ854_gp440 [Moumouvirus goulette]|uniref:C3H1-type domain-containing protein n=1 Tax=Moumouvirus goulette TaxID=1247379 RepID=M1PX60_9VIRU|nr:hypothetical protein QJ854_gp440 [Moumouvirus goulette]AGF85342.1 hypothetical protein glt_00533 [Moumouvirus goulette]
MDSDFNTNQNNEFNYEIEEDGYDSNDEIKIEITDSKNGKSYTHIYTVPYRPTHCNEKRLLCFSINNNEKCIYNSNCTYAHSLEEQLIDEDKKYLYKMVLDENLMNFSLINEPKKEEIYKRLFYLTHLCDQCKIKKCTGGFNCRNGVCNIGLKICKNDLLTGECINKITDIKIDDFVLKKLGDVNFKFADLYQGCINGHHLSLRGLIPYYKYIHQKENSKKNKYQSVRYIDIDPINRIFKSKYNSENNFFRLKDYDSESTDEEIDSWFRKEDDLSD